MGHCLEHRWFPTLSHTVFPTAVSLNELGLNTIYFGDEHAFTNYFDVHKGT